MSRHLTTCDRAAPPDYTTQCVFSLGHTQLQRTSQCKHECPKRLQRRSHYEPQLGVQARIRTPNTSMKYSHPKRLMSTTPRTNSRSTPPSGNHKCEARPPPKDIEHHGIRTDQTLDQLHLAALMLWDQRILGKQRISMRPEWKRSLLTCMGSS